MACLCHLEAQTLSKGETAQIRLNNDPGSIPPGPMHFGADNKSKDRNFDISFQWHESIFNAIDTERYIFVQNFLYSFINMIIIFLCL